METFVVRVWRAAGPESGMPPPGLALRGFAEHVGTGVTTRFGGGDELLGFLRRLAAPADPEELGTVVPLDEGDR